MEYYHVALKHDPDYALAYPGIWLAWAGSQQMGIVPPSEAGPQTRDAAERALELDSTLVEAQYASALVKGWTDWDWPAAETAFLRAIELNPNYPDVRAYYSHFLCSMKRQEEAMEQMERAAELDPFHPLIMGLHGAALAMVGRYDDAIAKFQALLRTVPNHPVALNGLFGVYYVKGMHEESKAAVAEVAWIPPIEVGFLYGYAGMNDQAVEWYHRGFEDRDPTCRIRTCGRLERASVPTRGSRTC